MANYILVKFCRYMETWPTLLSFQYQGIAFRTQKYNMEYTPKPLMQDDCLKLLKIVGSDIFRIKPMKILLPILLLSQLAFVIITVYAALFELQMREFVGYAPVFISSFQGILALYTLIFKEDLMDNFLKMSKWSLDTAGPEIHSRLLFEAKLAKIFTVFNVILTLIGTGYFCVPLQFDTETFYMLYFIENNFPNQERLWKFLYRGTTFLVGYLMVVHAYQLLYATQHGRFQIILYTPYVANLAEQEALEEVREEDLYYNENYQKMIKERLRFCVIRHQEFLNIFSAQLKQLRIIIILFSICGSMLGISLVFYMFSDKFTVDYYPRVGFCSLAACSTFCAMVYAGQSIETQSDITFKKINKIAWYHFNHGNKKIYSIMLLKMMQPWKMQVTENYSVNYELGRTIVQGIYSIMSVVVNWL